MTTIPNSLQVKYAPNQNQKAALDHAWSVDYIYTVTSLCKAVGVSRAAYYEWFHNVQFAHWWMENWTVHFALNLPRVYAIMMLKASGDSVAGDVAAAKLIAERFDKGYIPHSRQDIAGVPGAPLKTYICVNPADVTGIPQGEDMPLALPEGVAGLPEGAAGLVEPEAERRLLSEEDSGAVNTPDEVPDSVGGQE